MEILGAILFFAPIIGWAAYTFYDSGWRAVGYWLLVFAILGVAGLMTYGTYLMGWTK